ncbi:unnamed protein product [Mytilus coruscus]|uniref:Uncharacterized protein n=1 Tax=Mytilus coruscus TaxID=42192 RepID=A0A6J8C453_MYTCO|nr:unnamed protein product [Mytilus coruscus]
MKKIENILSKKQKLGSPVHDEIAKIVNQGAESAVDHKNKEVHELVDKYVRPQNCEFLEVPKVNQVLWNSKHPNVSKMLTDPCKELRVNEDEKISPNYLFGDRENLERMKEIDDSTKLDNKMKVKSAWNRDKAHVHEVEDANFRHDDFNKIENGNWEYVKETTTRPKIPQIRQWRFQREKWIQKQFFSQKGPDTTRSEETFQQEREGESGPLERYKHSYSNVSTFINLNCLQNTTDNYVAGKIAYYSETWKTITSDRNLLNIVC